MINGAHVLRNTTECVFNEEQAAEMLGDSFLTEVLRKTVENDSNFLKPAAMMTTASSDNGYVTAPFSHFYGALLKHCE